MRSNILKALTAPILAFVLACQSHEFEALESKALISNTPVIPIQAKKLSPNVLLVVDKSGSMGTTTDGVSRWSIIKQAFTDPVTGFLKQASGKADFSLMVFPSDNICSIGQVQIPLTSSTDQIVVGFNAISPAGGTPIAGTINEILKNDEFLNPNKRHFVLLLTDGEPNCNPSLSMGSLCNQCNVNPTICSLPNQCMPTWIPVNIALPCDTGLSCLDELETIAAATALRSANTDIFVVGFGSATTSTNAKRVLNKIAEIGGQAQTGALKYYQADDAAGLRAILNQFITVFQACKHALTPKPTNPNLVMVHIYDKMNPQLPEQRLAKDTDWTYDEDQGVVTILSNACDFLANIEEDGRYELHISYLDIL